MQNFGERQAGRTLAEIRNDHISRYELAGRYISRGARVLDIACGVGYGSYVLAMQSQCRYILAVDQSKDAIEYGKAYYRSDKIQYRVGDCLTTRLKTEFFDVVVCLEIIEHIKQDKKLLDRLYLTLTKEGKLILSTPNELYMPYSEARFPYHVRHYTPQEVSDLLESRSFMIESVYCQPDRHSKEIVEGWEGLFNIVVCSKKYRPVNS